MKNSTFKTLNALLRLWKYLSKKRKRQINIIFIVIHICALAELCTIGSVIPLLTILNNPETLWEVKSFNTIFLFLGFEQSNNLLLLIVLLFCLACCMSASIRIFNIWFSGRLSAAIGSDLGYLCYKNTLNQPYEVHLERNTSEVISSLISQLDITVKSINLFLNLISGSIISLFLIITLFFLNSTIALFGIFFIGSAYVLIARLTKNNLSRNSEIIISSDRSRIKAVQEGLGGIRDVILGSMQDLYLELFLKAEIPLRKVFAQNNFISTFPRYGLEALILVSMTLFAYILSSGKNNESLIPLLGTIVLCAQRLLPSLQAVFSGWVALSSYSSSIIHIINILNNSSSPRVFKIEKKENYEFKNLALNLVSFKYKGNKKEVLSDINLSINKGESIGIIGTTGGGKSTLMDLLMGLVKPTKGKFKINGKDLYADSKELLLYSWRESISHVPQNIFLSDASIAENIAFGIPVKEIDMERVKKSADVAQISEFISKSKHGYKTFVGERGIKLSGGQRQRIGIARALYKKSKILFLDEATSALDIYTERKLMQSLKRLDNKITIIMIAHRLSTVKDCNRVIRIENGRII